jgi:hypothetical protein
MRYFQNNPQTLVIADILRSDKESNKDSLETPSSKERKIIDIIDKPCISHKECHRNRTKNRRKRGKTSDIIVQDRDFLDLCNVGLIKVEHSGRSSV